MSTVPESARQGTPAEVPDPTPLDHALVENESRFDVREYARHLHGSLRDGIDTDAFARTPLAPAVAETLRFLRDAERGTMSQLRNMLVTPTHKDARVTAFLSGWAFEKYWIADALDTVLGATGGEVAEPSAPVRRGPGRALRGARERLRPIRNAIVGNAIGIDIVAVHVTLATVDEWVTTAWYDRVDTLAARPELTAVLDRIREVKSRHATFFEAESRERLVESPRARRLSRPRLKAARFPVAGPLTTPAEALAAGRLLFAGAAEPLQLVADRIRTLPGHAAVTTTLMGSA